MKKLFKNKNYSLLFAGSFVSEMGNVLFGFVAGLYVQDITNGKPIIFALFIALGAFVRLLFSPIAGVLVDRWDKVKIIYVTDFLRGLMFVAVAYVFFGGVSVDNAIYILLSVTVVSGIISAFFGPAVTSAIPEIVGLDQVQQANGANMIIQSVTMIGGVIFGAAAFGLFDFHIAVLLNGVSFLLSGISEMFIVAEHKTEVPEHETPHMLRDIKVGFRYIRTKVGLLRMMTFSLLINFAVSPIFSVAVPYFFRTELGRSEWEIAWVNIAFGISMLVSGIVIGSMVIKKAATFIRTNLVYLVACFLAVTALIYTLSHEMISYTLFYILMLIVHVVLAVFMIGTNVPLNTAMVKMIDPEVRGRVFSTLGAISGGAVPIAIFMSGVVIELTSVSFLSVLSSTILLIPTLGFLFDRKVRLLFQSVEEVTNEANEQAMELEEAYAN